MTRVLGRGAPIGRRMCAGSAVGEQGAVGRPEAAVARVDSALPRAVDLTAHRAVAAAYVGVVRSVRGLSEDGVGAVDHAPGPVTRGGEALCEPEGS
jgi:hypothetical protein